MDKLFAFAIFFFQILILHGQRLPVFQWTGLSTHRSQPIASHFYAIIDFDNHCIHIENGLGLWKNYSGAGTFTYPCIQTSEKIELQLHFYPNPASSIATIRAIVYTDLQRTITLTITDEIGRSLFQEKYSLYDLQQGVTLPVNYLLSGIYFLIITGDRVSGFKRFIKISK